jgi:ketosteroid isomerase-like protein
MTIETKNKDEAQIRQLIANWTEALRAKDVEGLMANYAPDVPLFDLAPPLQYKGADLAARTGRSGCPCSKAHWAASSASW